MLVWWVVGGHRAHPDDGTLATGGETETPGPSWTTSGRFGIYRHAARQVNPTEGHAVAEPAEDRATYTAPMTRSTKPAVWCALSMSVACTPDAGLTKYNAKPTASILSPTDGDTFPEGAPLTLRGAAGDPDDGPTELLTLWFVDDVEQCAAPAEADRTTSCDVVMPSRGTASVRLEVIDPGGAAASDTISLESRPSVELNLTVQLSPEDPHTDSILTATLGIDGVDPSAPTLAYAWSVDGAPVATGTDETLDGAVSFDRDQVVEVTVTATLEAAGTATASSAVTIRNSAPEPPTLTLSPTEPLEGESLRCAVATEASDADDDPVTYSFSWTVDGVAVAGTTDGEQDSTVPGPEVGADETWTCTVVADDGDASADPVSVSVVSAADCDRDGDAYDGPQCGGPDCNDGDPTIHPRGGDAYGDGADDDCDGLDCEGALTDGVYFIVCVQTSSISALDAQQSCAIAGHDGLSVPLNATENAAISRLNQALWPLRPLDNHNIRLGGTDVAVEGTWVHPRTGALLSYLNWADPEPNNSEGNEHCINMIGDPTWNGLWQDLGCFSGSNSDTAYSCEAR